MTPEDIERLGYGNESIWLRLEEEVMQDIARRIKQTGVVTRTADYQLNQIQNLFGYSDQQMKTLLQETMNASDEYIDRVFDEAIKTDYIDNKDLYKAKGVNYIPFSKNSTMHMLLNTLKSQSKGMHNLSGTLGFVINGNTGKRAIELSEYYKRILDDVMVAVASGGFDKASILKKAVSEMTTSGLRWIDYDSGHHNRVTVAARRAVTTGLSQMTQKVSEYNAHELGTTDYEVAWHANARPTHREWHGQVWTKEELVSVCGLGNVDGLCGANCYHVYYPFIKGLSVRNWSDEWLKEQNALENTPKTFNGKEYTSYEATQRQRVLETRMRAQRETIHLLKEGDGDPFDIMCAQAKYRASMDEYVKFSKAMSLREQRDRIYSDGLGQVGSMKKKGLYTKDELHALKMYTSSDSYKINERLRSGATLTAKEKKFIYDLDAALSKTKDYKGDVNRSVDFLFLDDLTEYIAMHKVDFPINYGQYISSTTDLVYNEKAQVQLHIKSIHGKDIRKYNQRENEILFESNTVFRVIQIEQKEKIWHIWLEEKK